MIIRHAGLFPDLQVFDHSNGRRRFFGYEDVARLPEKDLYVVGAKCAVFHTFCYNLQVPVDLDLAKEIVVKAKLLSPTVEHDVNVWIQSYNNGTVPQRFFDPQGVSCWRAYGLLDIFLPWNYFA
jgi:hypothetical protein